MCVKSCNCIRFVVFLQTIEWIGMVVRILNLKGHKHCVIDSKVTTILMTLLFMINSDFFWIWIQSAVDDGGVSRRRSVAVGVSDRWKVTCYMLHVICDM